MNVRELVDILKNYHDDMEVFLSSDAEGNKVSLLASYSPENIARTNGWEYDFDEENGVDSLVLWPVN